MFVFGTRFDGKILFCDLAVLHEEVVGAGVLTVVPRFVPMKDVLEAGLVALNAHRHGGSGDGVGCRFLLAAFEVDVFTLKDQMRWRRQVAAIILSTCAVWCGVCGSNSAW